MSDLSFEIKTSEAFFKKLQEDYKEFCIDKTSSRVALNCAMTAWHLTEWIFKEYYSQLISAYSTLLAFQIDIKRQCPSLQIMHDLTNGTKHYILTSHKPIIKDTTLHEGAFSSGFSRAFDISTLDIELNDGTKIYFEDEIEASIKFWIHYLNSTFNLTI
jgi:hypothetical protein